ncbi:MAG: chemotaxis protein CheB [Bacteroidetes bacterium GWA2_30_7]|nr:MAG: chemotaxis protein CheB [Bacteroidetes bacterium GWA2_30_7]
MKNKIILIGGSAGSFSVVTQILTELPKNFRIPIVLCLHRLKHVRSGFAEALSLKSSNPVIEPYDKDRIEEGKIYIAPANYHLYIEAHKHFALSTEDSINHSRPSIDVTFVSTASVYKENVIAIILSGANNDGAYGIKRVKDLGGITIVQNPEECQVSTMPVSSIRIMKPDFILSSTEIIKYLIDINNKAFFGK